LSIRLNLCENCYKEINRYAPRAVGLMEIEKCCNPVYALRCRAEEIENLQHFSDTLTLAWLERSIAVRLWRAEALAEVGQALRAGSTRRPRHREG
jgi:hypothetical protein